MSIGNTLLLLTQQGDNFVIHPSYIPFRSPHSPPPPQQPIQLLTFSDTLEGLKAFTYSNATQKECTDQSNWFFRGDDAMKSPVYMDTVPANKSPPMIYRQMKEWLMVSQSSKPRPKVNNETKEDQNIPLLVSKTRSFTQKDSENKSNALVSEKKIQTPPPPQTNRYGQYIDTKYLPRVITFLQSIHITSNLEHNDMVKREEDDDDQQHTQYNTLSSQKIKHDDDEEDKDIEKHTNNPCITATNITMNSRGKYFISDYHRHRICVLTNEGKWLRSFGNYGKDEKQFKFPGTIQFFGSKGNQRLMIHDTGNDRIQIYNHIGSILLQSIDLEAKFHFDEPVSTFSLDSKGQRLFLAHGSNVSCVSMIDYHLLATINPKPNVCDDDHRHHHSNQQQQQQHHHHYKNSINDTFAFKNSEWYIAGMCIYHDITNEQNSTHTQQSPKTTENMKERKGRDDVGEEKKKKKREVRIVICYPKQHCVGIYDYWGECIQLLGSYGCGVGKLDTPSGVTMDYKRHCLLIYDRTRMCIQIFDLHGCTWGDCLDIRIPNVNTDNTVDGLIWHRQKNQIIVCDSKRSRIQHFYLNASSGKYTRNVLFRYKKPGKELLSLPSAMTMDGRYNKLYLLDRNHQCVYKFRIDSTSSLTNNIPNTQKTNASSRNKNRKVKSSISSNKSMDEDLKNTLVTTDQHQVMCVGGNTNAKLNICTNTLVQKPNLYVGHKNVRYHFDGYMGRNAILDVQRHILFRRDEHGTKHNHIKNNNNNVGMVRRDPNPLQLSKPCDILLLRSFRHYTTNNNDADKSDNNKSKYSEENSKSKNRRREHYSIVPNVLCILESEENCVKIVDCITGELLHRFGHNIHCGGTDEDDDDDNNNNNNNTTLSSLPNATFKNPQSLALLGSKNGNRAKFVIADTGNDRIQITTTQGQLCATFGKQGTRDAQFNQPSGIAVIPPITTTTTTTLNHKINTTNNDDDGNLGGGDYSKYYKQYTRSRIVVADTGNHRIQVFDSDGIFISKFGTWGSGEGQLNRPTSLAIDTMNRLIVVCDSMNHRVQIFTYEGQFVQSVGEYGSDAGHFIKPNRVLVDLCHFQLLVSDKGNRRTQVFTYDRFQNKTNAPASDIVCI